MSKLTRLIGYDQARKYVVLHRKGANADPSDYLLFSSKKLICRFEKYDHIGVNLPRRYRNPYEIMNHPDFKEIVQSIVPILSFSDFFTWNYYVQILWQVFVYRLPKFQVKEEFVKFERLHKHDEPENLDADARARIVGMTSIKHKDPRVVTFSQRVGNDQTSLSTILNVSMAMVAEIMASPSIHIHDMSLVDVDSLINHNLKGLHIVNLEMHKNLTQNVISDTMQFIKYYIRYKRQINAPFLRLGECE